MTATGTFATVAVGIEAGVGTVMLNRPDKLNALTIEMAAELEDALAMLAGSDEVRCIVLTGAGKAFCAGADLGLLNDLKAKNDAETGRKIVDGCRAIYKAMREAPQIVLGVLNGAAAGGGAGLALACDLRIAAESARIGQVFAKLGLHPDWGNSYFLPRLVGASKAIEMFLDAEMVPAAELATLGVINRVVPDEELATAGRAWAARIAAAPPQAVRRMKQSVYASQASSLDDMLSRELEAQLACFATEDFTEGLAAFKAKRAPHFTGR
jgi:2-(1,2-epoxy-1,2-dihydrophenyl)acetyl-CoA isomerase